MMKLRSTNECNVASKGDQVQIFYTTCCSLAGIYSILQSNYFGNNKDLEIIIASLKAKYSTKPF